MNIVSPKPAAFCLAFQLYKFADVDAFCVLGLKPFFLRENNNISQGNMAIHLIDKFQVKKTCKSMGLMQVEQRAEIMLSSILTKEESHLTKRSLTDSSILTKREFNGRN